MDKLNVDQIDTLRDLVTSQIDGIMRGEISGFPGGDDEELAHLIGILDALNGRGTAAALDSDI